MNKVMRFVDAFAGIGGFRICAEAAGNSDLSCECVASIEFDDACRETYARNFGHKPTHCDITKINPCELPDHDLLMGGFPCQPFSKNGKFYNHNDKTLGDDDRKNLVMYLLAILAEKSPKAFVFENVKELATIRNTDGTGFLDTLLENLKSLGYAVQYKVLDAKDFGLPQQRKRIYIVGHKGNQDAFIWPSGVQYKRSVSDILESKVDEKYLIEPVWRKRMNLRLPSNKWDSMVAMYESGRWPRPLAPTGEVTPLAILYGDTPSGGPRQQDKLYSVMGVSPTIATMELSVPCFDTPQGWRKLTPRECARLQGFPDSFVLPSKDAVAYKQIGNSIAINVVKSVVSMVIKQMMANS
jgi:DNA (cytosine-5)-methyltransferase 1